MENWLVKKNVIFGVFDPNLGPREFHFCPEKQPKTAKRLGLGKKFLKKMLPGTLPTTVFLIVFSK